ncbi:MAG TPA: hypothetical protein DDW52_17335 [Planctomycetaceae bacterium]|nr:hypothetical protein [Planctomycetaceae bacterium]
MKELSTDSTQHITPETAEALLRLVLTSGNSTETTELSNSPKAVSTEEPLETALSRLLDADAAFRNWAESLSRRENTPVEKFLTSHFPECLLVDDDWLAKAALQGPQSPYGTLWNAGKLVCRLRELKTSFEDNLQLSYSRALYNFAYGLSHELNNPLANISTRAGVLYSRSSSEADRELLQTIVDSAMRGCEMLGDLMLIARPPKLDMQPLDVSSWISGLIERAKGIAASHSIEVVNHIADSDLVGVRIAADSSSLTEAVWALIRNGIEAQPDGGQIEICMRVAGAKHPPSQTNNSANTPAKTESPRSSQPMLHLQIDDRGAGLSEVALENCFDIFYSSREAGRGLGVGLAKSRRLIELHGGSLSIANRVTEGASVIVLLPLAEQ